MTIGRKPIQIVEIDMPRCTRTYGSLPCTAVLGTTGTKKCYNTKKTCQSVATYADAPFTMRFGQNQGGLPKDVTVFPALRSVSARAGRVNLSGIDPNRSPLGQRARVMVSLQDFAWQDTETDPYQSERVSGAAQSDGIGYDPKGRGTFFSRFHARWPFFLGKSLRVLDGYEGDAFAAMRTRHFVITEWKGPNAAGQVTITAADILDLADSAKSLAPAPSRGKLLAAITASELAATLTPAGVGAEYAASGQIVIGREIMDFTRSGDALTLSARGVHGTTAAAHSVGDLVQEVLVYDEMRADLIVSDLLQTFAGVPSAYIDAVAWQDEVERWLGGVTFSAVIAKPEGVAKLVGELCQHGLMIWWDEIAQEVRLKLNRPLDVGETYYVLSDGGSIIEGTAEIEDAEDERASQVQFWHGVIDPTQTMNGQNFKKLVVSVDATNDYGEDRIKVIYSRWFGSEGNDAAATVIAERLISRYLAVPRNLSCDLDVKDLATMDLTALVEAHTRLITDDTGTVAPYPMQVLYREEIEPGSRFRIEAQTFNIEGRFGWIMLDTAPDYDAASATEIAEGCFIVDEAILSFPDGTDPYVMF